MPRFTLLLAMALVHVQPLLGVLSCERHHQVTEVSCMVESGHQHHAGNTIPDNMPPMEHDCAMMAACAPSAPAIVPSFNTALATITDRLSAPSVPAAALPTALRAPPFHPPKA